MRHGMSGRKLNRTSSHRKALLMNLANSLLKNQRAKKNVAIAVAITTAIIIPTNAPTERFSIVFARIIGVTIFYSLIMHGHRISQYLYEREFFRHY